MVENDYSNLTPEEIGRICVGIAAALNSNSSLIAPISLANTTNSFDRPTPAKVWGIGLLFITLISLCAACGIALMPLLSRQNCERILTYFIGLGVGSLSGSAIFHLLPQAWELVDDGTSGSTSPHAYLSKAWMAIIGVYLFFMVDKLLKIILEYRKRRRGVPFRNISSSNHNELKIEKVTLNASVPNHICDGYSADGRPVSLSSGFNNYSAENSSCIANDGERFCPPGCGEKDKFAQHDTAPVDALRENLCSHNHDVSFKQGQSVIATVAWMVIFGDGLHNFIDGLSIGAAFTQSILSGISVSVAVFCEEFPHELGDVAILVAAGMTLRQALVYNLLSAATCYLGFILGVVAGELTAATTLIFALAAGMFLYISLGNMVPEMNTAMDKAMQISIPKGFVVLLLQIAGIITGLVLMFIMAYYGSQIQFG